MLTLPSGNIYDNASHTLLESKNGCSFWSKLGLTIFMQGITPKKAPFWSFFPQFCSLQPHLLLRCAYVLCAIPLIIFKFVIFLVSSVVCCPINTNLFTYLLTYSHTPNLEMLSHLKTRKLYLNWWLVSNNNYTRTWHLLFFFRYICDECKTAKENEQIYCLCRKPYDDSQ